MTSLNTWLCIGCMREFVDYYEYRTHPCRHAHPLPPGPKGGD